MKIPPVYTLDNEIISLITKIDAQRIYFSSINIPSELKNKIERQSLLKSSLYSAKIEGNPLELSDLNDNDADELMKKEVFNIFEAAHTVERMRKGYVSPDTVLKLHKIILNGLSPEAGRLRSEPSAIFNAAGIAVYLPPRPAEINKLLKDLFKYIHSPEEKFPLITAFISHLIFEKIHPFLDGNGRVGRLLISAILKSKGWDIVFSVAFEEYLNKNRDDYYYYLDKGMQKANEYLLFMLNAFYEQMQTQKEQIESQLNKKEFLSPRQEEIMNIIRDHNVVTFDTIRRRFLKVPQRTLRYDLKKLAEKGVVETSGQTRGRYYRIRNIDS